MSELNKVIIKLLNERKTLKAIAASLGMSEKQIFVRLKQIINYGYNLEPIYYYNSDISYNINGIENQKENSKENSKESSKENSIKIKMYQNDKTFRCIAISDIHIGHVNSNINLLKTVYEYATKNNINIILNCGDLIEGIHTSAALNIKDIYDQIETLIKKYPYDKNINNFILFGNHDIHSLYYDKLDISKRIAHARYDMIPIGYGKGILRIKNNNLLLEHNLSVTDNPNIGENCKVSLVGHGHMMKTKFYDKLYICLPSLSKVSPDKTVDIVPGFIDLEISLEDGSFEFVKAKHMIILNQKVYQAGESRCRINNFTKNEQFKNLIKK